jgi:hypothetical protein
MTEGLKKKIEIEEGRRYASSFALAPCCDRSARSARLIFIYGSTVSLL